MERTEVELRPWSTDDLTLLERQDTPEMTAYLGGPEGADRLRKRHKRFLSGQTAGTTWPFTIWTIGVDEPVASVVYWDTTWEDRDAYECGWATPTTYQRRGFAAAGVRLALAHAAALGSRDTVVAFPRVDHAASNGVARSAGFHLDREIEGEYPKGTIIRVNAWTFDLGTPRQPLS